ncbi:OmpA family protein [Luteolibacter sp. LG18]|uniref:OmpA family protein n=1 Tax=Luteolibacter sp. LG18 TaxID=2819286 RepID=UPI0030C7581F
MKSRLLLPAALCVLLASPLSAADEPGAKDHPMLKRVTGSEIIWAKSAKFDEMKIALEKIQYDYGTQAFKATKQESAEGARTTLYYRLPGDVSTLEANRQYEQELKAAGFTVSFTAANDELDDGYNRFVERIFPTALKTEQLQYLHEFNHEEQRYSVLKGKAKNGGDVYVSLYAFVLKDVSTGFQKLVDNHKLAKGQTVVRVDILETTPMEARMEVVKAAEITSSITTTGRIAIYGVHFDTDKAEIKPDSADSLTEMAKAIKEGGGRYLIVGHTDNQGEYAHNQTLSMKRAAAVTAALSSQYGIPSASLVPVGVGMAAPVAPNTEETGRAKNRRVEIVKM